MRGAGQGRLAISLRTRHVPGFVAIVSANCGADRIGFDASMNSEFAHGACGLIRATFRLPGLNVGQGGATVGLTQAWSERGRHSPY